MSATDGCDNTTHVCSCWPSGDGDGHDGDCNIWLNGSPAMTAPEPTRPADEHTDAVARAMRQDPKSGGRNMSDVAREVYAGRLLTSTDPAVQEALAANLPADVMLDALVRAGVLTEEWTVRHSQGVHPGPFTEKAAREWIASDVKRDAGRQFSAQGKQALLRRAVTPWEVAP